MKHFAALFTELLSGGKPRQVVKTAMLRALACEAAGIEDWLFDECYQTVGDLAETIAYILPLDFEASDVGLAVWIEQRLLPLRGLDEEEIAQRIKSYWRELDARGRFLLIKLLVQRALAAHSGLDAKRIAQRMMGYVDAKVLPDANKFEALIVHSEGGAADVILDGTSVKLSPIERLASWPDFAALRTESRVRGVEGFMLKRVDAMYGTGRTKADGLWWKWKIEPMTIDCVLIYAQAGHGRRASLYTDYTFAVWNRQPANAQEADAVVRAIEKREPAKEGALQLTAFAKAYSGLTDEEFKLIDSVIRKTTQEKFGPVRSVKPTLVFELGFEGINLSPRHKIGIAVRFPRMLRIRSDKPLNEVNTLDDLKMLLN